MTAVEIPVDRLRPETLQGIIEEYVTRDGTDYGKTDIPIETKIRQVKSQLESGLAVLVYDNETQTCNILSADDPVLKSLSE